ncbi:MAG: hypothetical protein ACREPV_07700 [Lysobacter sp.]
MNRKLHNTLSALTASGALLVVSLIAAAPMSGPNAAPAFTGATPIATELSTAQALVDAIGTAAAQTIETGSTEIPRSTGTSTHNRRQTLVMPYFSFLPRG